MAIAELVTRALRSSPKRLPPTSTASSYVAPNRGLVGKGNVKLYRNWARGSEWVRAAINIRTNQIATAEWDIVPLDDTRAAPVRLQNELRELFEDPNPDDRTFAKFSMRVLEDLLILDAGCIEKDRSLDNRLRRVWPVDGGDIKVNAKWDGDPNEARYFWYPDHTEHAKWVNDDFVYMMANPSTASPIGVPPLETLKMVIDALVAGDDYQIRQLHSAAPDGLLDLGEGVNPNQIDDFRRYWLSEVAGKGAMAFIGGTKGSKFVPFRSSNRDMQFQEWTVWLVRKVAAVYGLSPQDLGLTMDINRANAEQQAENTEDRGLRPLMALVQDYFTREIVHDPSFGGKSNNLAFRFTRLNLKETTSKAGINKLALAGVPWKTPNEARRDDGRAPISEDWADQLIMRTATGVVRLADIPSAGEAMSKVNTGGSPAGEPLPEQSMEEED
jgi:hypothetical protein